jgi:carbon-monoxide dehydrogenase medium subunit
MAHVAHIPIRNRGTVVGSLCHADAAAEMPMVLSLLGGSVDVASVRGTRTIPADELYAGPLESTLAADELAVSAYVPALAQGEGVAFEEIARRHGDYALVGVAAHVSPERVRLGYLSVSDTPTVVDVTGEHDPVAAALAVLEPVDDIHATADYRAHLVRVLSERVLASAQEMARRGEQSA